MFLSPIYAADGRFYTTILLYFFCRVFSSSYRKTFMNGMKKTFLPPIFERNKGKSLILPFD